MCTAKTVRHSPRLLIPCPHPLFLATLSTWQGTGVKAATPVGNLFGQLIFGWLADVVGRKRMCKHGMLDHSFLHSNTAGSDGIELMIMIIATFGQALSGQAPAVGIIGVLIVWRFIVSPSATLVCLHCLIIPLSDGRRNRR